ncbi:MAG: ABC transporter ATP-binding protein/permease [Oscillospiraceae bacterium]|nr:ABC transporter ATP-binding protein/permease [Oscillospiraceae bacterium]
MDQFKWIGGYLRRHKGYLALGFACVTAFSIFCMVPPVLARAIVDGVIIGGDRKGLPTLLALIMAVSVTRQAVGFTRGVVFEHISQSVVYRIRMDIYDKLQSLEFAFFDRNRTGDLMARLTGDMEAVRHFVGGVLHSIYERASIFIFATVMVFTVHVPIALCLVGLTPIIAFMTYRFAREVRLTFLAVREQFSRLNSTVQESVSGNKVVKAFAQEGFEIAKHDAENAEYMERNLDTIRVWQRYIPILDIMAGSLTVIVILAGGLFSIYGGLTLGGLIMVNGYLWALNDPMRMAGWLISDTQRFVASCVKIMGLLETDPAIAGPAGGSAPTAPMRGAVEFRGVRFAYGEGAEVLRGIDFKVPAGCKVAVMGATGSGKSTFVSLISRFYDCTAGEVLIDGVDVRDREPVALRESVSTAMQDVFLFSDTIEGNIAYGVPDVPFAEVVAAAKVACAHGFIEAMPEGYDTIIGERGVGLSGGQRQRIALARAVIKAPSILILDDTTSSVDMETEVEVQRNLKSAYGDMTVFIVAHRISSVRDADVIFVLDDGLIAERGTHEELLDAGGLYREIYDQQMVG